MADLFNYNDPIIPQWRDTIKERTEMRTVYNHSITLSEIPDFNSHVQITGYTEVFPPAVPSANQFITDYRTGQITFHESVSNGTVVSVRYFGKGVILIPISRVYSQSDNPDVIQTLQDILDQARFDLQTLHEEADTARTVGRYRIEYNPSLDTLDFKYIGG